jgi:hypothetical protein
MVGPDLKDAFSLNDPHFQSLNLKLFCCATSDFLRLQFQVKKEMLLTVMICAVPESLIADGSLGFYGFSSQ